MLLTLAAFCVPQERGVQVSRGRHHVRGEPLHIAKPPIPQMKMMKVHIPFTFKLQESSRSSYCGECSAQFFSASGVWSAGEGASTCRESSSVIWFSSLFTNY
ncbi:hypothetical protein PR048_018162 [Dryococelus australis]|uniref:Uncharacterized protein n=1 Tax=Dryococelus australis TaxID=614101 RepID=A0ABQ9HBV0_9NEOP|nr:hypothetical protein PR048_018162 [Dryococelus australis]